MTHNPETLTDAYWMQHALELAAKGEGLTRPNPPVGAVVVRDGAIVGEGFHPRAGQPHAEIFALQEAGKAACGATLYVTLEPCSTHGRTPPCTEAIITAGVRRVVYGCVDPNPRHAGRADRILRRGGIEVTRPVLEDACRTIIRPFATRMLEKRPFLTIKLACSLDGRIADRQGRSKWITGKAARGAVQELRRAVDAIMVGAETVRRDDPSLLPRPALGRMPWRVIVAGRNRLPLQAKVFRDQAANRTIVMVPAVFPQRDQLMARGIECVTIPMSAGHLSMKAVLRELARRGCLHVCCEGGGVLAQSLLKTGWVDQLWMMYAPMLLGDAATPAIAGSGWQLNRAPSYTIRHVEPLGPDVLLVAEPQSKRRKG